MLERIFDLFPKAPPRLVRASFRKFLDATSAPIGEVLPFVRGQMKRRNLAGLDHEIVGVLDPDDWTKRLRKVRLVNPTTPANARPMPTDSDHAAALKRAASKGSQLLAELGDAPARKVSKR